MDATESKILVSLLERIATALEKQTDMMTRQMTLAEEGHALVAASVESQQEQVRTQRELGEKGLQVQKETANLMASSIGGRPAPVLELFENRHGGQVGRAEAAYRCCFPVAEADCGGKVGCGRVADFELDADHHYCAEHANDVPLEGGQTLFSVLGGTPGTRSGSGG